MDDEGRTRVHDECQEQFKRRRQHRHSSVFQAAQCACGEWVYGPEELQEHLGCIQAEHETQHPPSGPVQADPGVFAHAGQVHEPGPQAHYSPRWPYSPARPLCECLQLKWLRAVFFH